MTPGATRTPKIVKSGMLAPKEFVLMETHPALPPLLWNPILIIIIFYFLAYSAFAVTESALRPIPGLTYLWSLFGSVNGFSISLIFAYVFVLIGLYGIIRLVIRLLRWRFVIYAITTQRLMLRLAAVSSDLATIPVYQIRGMNMRRSIWGRMFGWGNLTLVGIGPKGSDTTLPGVKKPIEFQRLLQAANQALIGRSPTPQQVTGQ